MRNEELRNEELKISPPKIRRGVTSKASDGEVGAA